ncbi:microcin C transport system substrate-binding protein [Mesorhizobium albiziae]|uniref:Microcin C transport system substrate-binding protein n=1 Tax=Neomesorhizobium albiziae TaxID=335020 RepID=A0A1I3WHJ9_9HYPH|nr:extracellular solute-binding protein [Mesorhizobium albiziae]GLS31567.1 ABC transporter substrate-binding protein [Mesorhizobium albiziae]SFK05926.1 microcin C transport system substrate-binding protein [Mesorhizobium albiziae]
MTVRRFLGMTGLAAALIGAATLTTHAEDKWRTTSSLIGESKYGEDFKHYDYVNPDAPKGGTLNSTVSGTFDSFNPYIVRGSPAAGLIGFGGGYLYDTLMEQATDEGSVSHPLVADAYKYPDDYSSATYRLDPRAKWHDGQPITVDDIVWSFGVLKSNSPLYAQYYANVTEAVALNDREVEFRFNQKGNRELPKIIGDMVVLPRHWWEGTDASGKKRDITQPTLEPPLGSAAYKIESFKPGAEIVWSRVPDYWGAKLPVKIGRENVDRRRIVYFQDDNAAWQAFTKGGLEDIQAENSSRRWATYYNFPAFTAGDVIKKEFKATSRAAMQGFVMNQRRPLFQDRKVREALTYAFDFETMNRTIFFGFNTRTDSFFEGGELASRGLPEGKELEILSAYKDQLPPEVFTKEYKLPVYGTPQAERQYLRQIVQLFGEAGWKIQGGKMVNAKGEQFKLEILGNNETDEVIANPYINMLKKVGIDASLRIVDPNQYVQRVNNFDFDMLTNVMAQSDSPGNEQRDFWSTKAADTPGSRNLAGIKNPVVDALIDKVIFATDREDLIASTRALDRVLLWNFYVVPQYHRSVVWLAYWNKFGMPDKQPDYIGADVDSWWIDAEKEKALAAKYKSVN